MCATSPGCSRGERGGGGVLGQFLRGGCGVCLDAVAGFQRSGLSRHGVPHASSPCPLSTSRAKSPNRPEPKPDTPPKRRRTTPTTTNQIRRRPRAVRRGGGGHPGGHPAGADERRRDHGRVVRGGAARAVVGVPGVNASSRSLREAQRGAKAAWAFG